ncbi:autophagy-related protein 2 homolog A [Pseudoliparis swirei]|uniref:autophagy-related protein 2 homolog A n=1 Tax=Pseudoliparis swirei TaxID=2059687 RepID=UPI0024BF083C|nr:autophagy-related protein 2 homolog A [Pseudoliparis swirei]XP_056294880.1 autophagy-related protein 2 homolog A [Pseudoliparis swirei]
MSPWLFPWPGSIKKRACRYLLQHYLGHFLQERLSLEQLGLDLYNGSGVIKEINLDVWAVNELLETLGAPLEIVDGFVSSITVTIPWQALLTDHCTLEVSGLQITCRPKYRTSGGWDSQGWSSSMTSSMQLAQECLKDPPEASEEPPAQLEGLEMFAQTIETVLRRIKVTFIDTIVRIEHQPLDLETGVALEVHIKRLEYFDEAVRDPASQTTVPVDIHQPPSFLHKILQLSAVQLFYDSNGTAQGPHEEKHPESAMASEEEEEEEEEMKEKEEEDVQQEDEEEEDDERKPLKSPPCPASQPLLIGSCPGFIETTVKIKQDDMLPGPKLELEGKVGCVHMLLSPDQITHLTDLLSALCIDTEIETKCGGALSRPLDSDDLRLIEDDLSKQLGSSPRDREWETEAHLEPFITGMENGDMFFSMGPGMTSSGTSVRSGSELSDSDMESSTHSLSSFTQPAQGMASGPRRYPGAGCLSSLPQASSRTRGRSHSGQAEQLKPDALLRLTLGGLTLTLLQEDPPSTPDGGSSLAQVSQVFFRELAFFKDSMFSERDFHHLRGSFAKACPHSHLRVTGAAVQVACEMRSGRRHSRAMTSDLSFSRLELLESLWEDGAPQYSELLQFQKAGLFTIGAAARPCAQLHYSLTEKHLRKGKQRVVQRDSVVRVELAELSTELDLDILSRLGKLSKAFSHCPTHTAGPGLMQTQSSELCSSFTLLSPHAILRLRFPIPDLRPLPKRRPSSQRAVRQETLVLELSQLELKHQEAPDLQSEQTAPGQPWAPCLTQLLEASFTDLHGSYEGWEGGSFPCIRVKKNSDSLPRISVCVRGGETQGPAAGLDGMNLIRDLGAAFFESHCELNDKTSSPFSSNRTMFETEEMVIPADPEEMRQFQAQCVAQCQCAVDINLPLAYILLPSKQAFQSFYNRINNDLLMWEPPPPSAHSPNQSRHHHDEFQLCKSAFRRDSDSEEDEPHFYLASESSGKTQQSAPRPNHNLSLLSLTVIIGKGRLQARTDKKEDQSHGEIVLDLEEGKIFSVAQHQNDPNLNFLCIESRKVELYHRALVKNTPIPQRLEMPNFTPPKHLDPTIYPTEVGVSSVSGKEGELQMLSTAIKITLDPQRSVKEFLVALRLQGATMRHYMMQTNHSWHEQLVDFLDVIDDPILGYTAPAVITVLHTHLATCAVDYRPLYLPLRMLFTTESFSLSSNIIVDTTTFHLRFILDDSALYLSDKCETDTVDLRRDYLCFLDIDLLELAITTWKGSNTGKLSQPLFELRCSNNVVHLHTCADSCAALVNLLQYVVSQGDLHPPPRHTSPTEIAGQKLPLSESPASVPPCPPAETAEINQYDLADALIDTEKSQREESSDPGSPSMPRGSPVSVYLFPGEASKRVPSELQEEDSELDGLVAIATEAQADVMLDEGSEGSNDDFCILEAPGMGIPPRDGEPMVTVLSQGPIKVKESHFSRPRGSSDLLRAPSRFPVPQSRVVLREISVVWHLYGGKDFGGKPMSIHAQHTNRGRGSPSRSAAPSRPQNSWRWAGGSGRQHALLMEIQLTKVSFQHESYAVAAAGPDGDGQVGVGPGGEQPLSRQVFIVQELEIRDRLASSQINKFLYLYTSESMPRRAHSNMLTVKALQVCPESGLGGPECCLRVSLLPLRLNIDQDALFFLKDFFSNLASFVNPYLPVDPATEVRADTSQKASDEAESAAGLDPDLTASVETTFSEQSSSSAGSTSLSDQPIYFREFRFTSEVPIWLDYQGKHVVIEQGTFAGILIGLAQLNCSELKLKRLCCRHGLLGVDKVIQYAVTEWLTDIRKNQLPGLLGGVGPMHSVVQLFHGVRDLFWLPIEQYRKDGRIIRGLQRGAASFGTSTASAALELSNRLVQAIQATAETVYDILSPTPPLNRFTKGRAPSSRPRRAAQPADLREGVAKAYDTVREGMIDTAQTLCDVASRGHQQKGLPGAVGGVLRQIPPTVVRPLIVASEATSNLLGGMRNQIKPDARKEDFLKWRTDDGQE